MPGSRISKSLIKQGKRLNKKTVDTLPRFSYSKMSEVGLPVGGYPTEIFKKGFDLKVLCNACNRVLRDPVQSYCGHRFCRECISAIIRWGYIVWKTQMCLMTGPPLSTSIHPKDLDLQSMCTPSPFPNIWTNRYLCKPTLPTPPPPPRIKMQVGDNFTY